MNDGELIPQFEAMATSWSSVINSAILYRQTSMPHGKLLTIMHFITDAKKILKQHYSMRVYIMFIKTKNAMFTKRVKTWQQQQEGRRELKPTGG